MKSNVSDYIEIMDCVYKDATMKCVADVSDLRDLETIRSRVKDEGLSFLTITLPNFCRDFERSLDLGYVAPTCFRNFRKYGLIPAFLRGITVHVFDCETGRIRDGNNYPKTNNGVNLGGISDYIEAVRQICLVFKKIELPCSLERETAAIEGFVATEQSFQDFVLRDEDRMVFDHTSSLLWNDLVRTIVLDNLVPRHGPGATAERVSGNRKFQWLRWHDRLEPYFPLYSNAYPLGMPEDAKELKSVTIVPVQGEQPVRVTLVPKTLKGPRIIAIEPCCMQYVQQAVQKELYARIERFRLTAGRVNFTDQSINQELAMKSSKEGHLATIDLSDASDRVPAELALSMFNGNPDLRDAIEACRSTMAELPNGTVIGPLKKFASMGSALCFPVEAMYFYTICVVALLNCKNLPVTSRNIQKVSRDIHVYGDDIIVPQAYATSVLDYLQKYNCKVNVNKTFYSGSFRESCGLDAFNGYEVTPTYIVKECPVNRRQASEIISWVETANHFYKRGYWRTAELMFYRVQKIVGPLPYVSETSECLGRISYLSWYRTMRWNQKILPTRWNCKLQRQEVLGLVQEPVRRTDELEGYAALTKGLLKLKKPSWKDLFENKDETSFEQSALHGAVTLKRRWCPSH